MGGLLGGTSGSSMAASTTAAVGMQIQTSTYGRIRPVGFGRNRVAPNLIWYGDPTSLAQGGGGKNSGGKGLGGGGGSSSHTEYYASFVLAVLEGPIESYNIIWKDKGQDLAWHYPFEIFGGTYDQAPWSYLVSVHPDQADAFPGLALLAIQNADLGQSPDLAQYNVEYQQFVGHDLFPAIPDDCADHVVSEMLTNENWGARFPSAFLGDLTTFKAYTIAAGLWLSPLYDQQTTAQTELQTIAELCNCDFVWSEGQLTILPYGDLGGVASNGYAWAAPTATLASLTDDDFLPYGQGEDPVQLDRTRPSDVYNQVTLEYLDRNVEYAPVPMPWQDDAAVSMYGPNPESTTTAHCFAQASSAQMAARMRIARLANGANTYKFKTDYRFIWLNPMDIIDITDEALGAVGLWLRIKSIEEQSGALEFTCEEAIFGATAATTSPVQGSGGFSPNLNAAAPSATATIVFEPPDALANGLEMRLGVCGPAAEWGGCDVYLSTGGDFVIVGTIYGGSTMGVLSAALPAIAPAPTGQTIDQADALSVDLTQSDGALISATQQDALALNTLCYIADAGGELLAFETATLTAPEKYNLTYLVRGAYTTASPAHAAGAQFVKVDASLLRIPYTADRVGQTVQIKLCSFNQYGLGKQTLDQVQPFAYTIQGTALTSPLPAIQNLRLAYVGGRASAVWDAVSDFRPVQYEIRGGASAQAAQSLGRIAGTSFPVPGNGTYWIAAVSQPLSGLTVYGPWEQIAVTGTLVQGNTIVSYDEGATGWTGTCAGAALVENGEIVLDYSGNVLGVADWLNQQDILHMGTLASAGAYQIPASHRVDAGRVALCDVAISFAAIGQIAGENILAVSDLLGQADILGNAASANISVTPQIRVAQADGVFGAWQDFSPGQYSGQFFDFQVVLSSRDPQTQAFLQSFAFSVNIEDRIDDYIGIDIPAGGLALVYTWPPGTGAAAPFNSGPNGAPLPNVQVTLLNGAAGDEVVFSNQSLAGVTVQVLNAGAGVARTANILAKGY